MLVEEGLCGYHLARDDELHELGRHEGRIHVLDIALLATVDVLMRSCEPRVSGLHQSQHIGYRRRFERIAWIELLHITQAQLNRDVVTLKCLRPLDVPRQAFHRQDALNERQRRGLQRTKSLREEGPIVDRKDKRSNDELCF